MSVFAATRRSPLSKKPPAAFFGAVPYMELVGTVLYRRKPTFLHLVSVNEGRTFRHAVSAGRGALELRNAVTQTHPHLYDDVPELQELREASRSFTLDELPERQLRDLATRLSDRGFGVRFSFFR